MAYDQIWDKVWFKPTRSFRLACCSCGLVHDIDFRLKPRGNGIEIEMRMNNHPKATAARRRTFRFTKDDE
jgi:hypothetical protein